MDLHKKEYTRQEQDAYVRRYCKKFNCAVPEKWCYLGDLLFDIATEEVFFPVLKELADIRRRSLTFKRVRNYDVDKLTLTINLELIQRTKK